MEAVGRYALLMSSASASVYPDLVAAVYPDVESAGAARIRLADAQPDVLTTILIRSDAGWCARDGRPAAQVIADFVNDVHTWPEEQK